MIIASIPDFYSLSERYQIDITLVFVVIRNGNTFFRHNQEIYQIPSHPLSNPNSLIIFISVIKKLELMKLQKLNRYMIVPPMDC